MSQNYNMDRYKNQSKTINEYINSSPKAVREKLQTLRVIIHEEVPEATELSDEEISKSVYFQEQ